MINNSGPYFAKINIHTHGGGGVLDQAQKITPHEPGESGVIFRAWSRTPLLHVCGTIIYFRAKA